MNRSELILKAAESCMREKGFRQTSVQNIAREAGVSVGLIYKYYENKEAIIEALVTRVVKNMIDLLNADFEKIAHAGSISNSMQDIVPPALEHNIVLLMEVSAEATRNTRIHQIMRDAWQELKNNFIHQEQLRNSKIETSTIYSRLYIMSLIIDGMIIRRSMKQRDLSTSFMSLFNTITQHINRHDAG
ncbi:TetR/AcrR family transcriptional regulator [Pantoea piersonii]|uniref:TetR/AcrR family transcriptional regulator n=1 Tax=Pantoea piersonii TaxID=2364647 RepID=UPI00289A75D4|nr:helix-turn-helix domain-containing protein [Pantoea piersonii]MDU6440477.1 helix-turn-helix domain-containing protein [Pantoea sp.]